MFRTKNNLRRNAKHKEHKNAKKTSYVEDYNEVILNDLVDDNKSSNEDNVQEEPIRKTKKKKTINLNLGTKKKSTSNEDKNNQGKTLNKKHKNHNDDPKEIIDVDSKKDTPEVEAKPKDNKSTKPSKSKKTQKQSQKSSKKKSKNQPSEENTKKSSKKASKKSNKATKEDKTNKTTKKSRRERKEEEINTKSVENVENVEIEEVEELNDDEEIVEGSIFRNIEEDEELMNQSHQAEAEEERVSEHKFEDIIWSDDKFPKN